MNKLVSQTNEKNLHGFTQKNIPTILTQMHIPTTLIHRRIVS
jgi:hypothetical protein